jgi:uncharacterized damage-inducible protein DinB
MIGRLWHGWTAPANADAYEALLRSEILPGIHRVDGYHGACLLRSDGGGEVAFVTLTFFDSIEDVKAFAGDDYEKAVILPHARALLSRADATSKHYQVMHMPDASAFGSGLAQRFRHLFAYERDAHAKTLASLHALDETSRASKPFEHAADLLAHVVAARWLWLFRMGGTASPPAEVFPKGVPVDALAERIDEMHAVWTAYLAQLTDARIVETFEYRSLEGEPFRNTVEDVLTQLYGHSLYHRGQIAAIVRSLGGEPAVTDFVFWSRRSI